MIYENKSAYNFLPIQWDFAINDKVWSNGKEYIDFTSGIFVTNIGHSATIKDIQKQISEHLIYSYNHPTKIRTDLVEQLIQITPKFAEKVILSTTGAEAIEIACKLMRMLHNRRNRIKDRGYYISFKGAMHGKTRLTEALKGYDEEGYVLPLSFPKENYSFEESIKDINPYDVMGFVIESYRGWDGKFYPKQYIQDLVKWAKENNVLVCFDEVQGGFWRTGKMFAYEHYEVEPDLICVGKALGNGMPISAVLGKKEIIDCGTDVSSTYAGNPLSCASALSTLIQLEELNKGREFKNKIKYCEIRLKGFKLVYPDIIKEINGNGFLWGITFKNRGIADKISLLAMKKGLLVVNTGRESIKIGPPLIISKQTLFDGFLILEECIREVVNV